jgi:hypothetical protein
MFSCSPTQFAELRAVIHEHELARLKAKQNDPRLQLFYEALKEEVEAELQKARANLEAYVDISHISVDCYIHECGDEDESTNAHRLLKELQEAGFKAWIQYDDDRDAPFAMARSRRLVISLTGV